MLGSAGAAFGRELKLAWSGGGGAALPVGFFAGAVSLTPLALGPEPDLLLAAGPGVLWIALALSSLLPMERLYQADLEDGTLDAYTVSGFPLEGLVLAKTLAHWIASAAPLTLISPLLWVMLQGPVSAIPAVLATAAAGSLSFFFFGSIGAALAAGVRRGGLLITLVALPLFSPAMIFGASALYAAANGNEWTPGLLLTAAVSLFSAAISPFAAALALRSAID